MKSIKTIASLAFAGLVLAACSSQSAGTKDASTSSDLLATIQQEGVIQVGTEGTYSPYSYHDESGKLVGYDVEVATKVAEKLGVTIEFVETEWDSMIAGLDAGRYDLIANQVSITDERKEKYDFSHPYTYIYGALIAHKDTKDIADFDGIKGKKSANTLTSNWGKLAQEKGAEIVVIDGFSQAIDLLTSGRADVTINDNVAFLDYKKQHPDAPIQVIAQTKDAQKTAFPVVKGNDKLVAAIDKALEELAEEGVLTALSEKYFGSDVSRSQD